jgi:hypothetical protein
MFGANAFDFAIDVEDAFDTIAAMTWCHQSQIVEWLPWVGRHGMAPPASQEEWAAILRARFDRTGRELGIASAHATEVFRVTAWGAVPTLAQLQADFPPFAPASNLDALDRRLRQWNHA